MWGHIFSSFECLTFLAGFSIVSKRGLGDLTIGWNFSESFARLKNEGGVNGGRRFSSKNEHTETGCVRT